MLQDYHRRTTIKPFAPILKDRSSKRWDSEISIATNLSLLSISNSSKSSNYEDENIQNQHLNDTNSSSSQESISTVHEEVEEHKTKHVNLDPYIFNKHLYRIPSTISKLNETDFDKSINNLFDENKLSNSRQTTDDWDPRSIRPPSFIQYIKQLKKSQIEIQPIQHRSIPIPVRTTKAEQLKLARLRSATGQHSQRSLTKIPQQKPSFNFQRQQSAISSRYRILSSRTIYSDNFTPSQSIRLCEKALHSNNSLHLSSLLIKQMQQDIQNNRIPKYSKPLNSALLREQPNLPLNHQYKMKRIYHWLEKIIPTDFIEYNEYASNESTAGTYFNDKLDDEYDVLSDEKLPDNTERTYAEAHRILPLLKTENDRKIRHNNLVSTRLELDLYVM